MMTRSDVIERLNVMREERRCADGSTTLYASFGLFVGGLMGESYNTNKTLNVVWIPALGQDVADALLYYGVVKEFFEYKDMETER